MSNATAIHAPDVVQTKREPAVHRIVILGGGFGGVYTTHHLEQLFRHDAAVEIILVSRNNYFLMTPLLFEASSGVLEPRHSVNPIRRMYKKARFVEGTVDRVDVESRRIYARHVPDNYVYEIEYDELVLALGGVTNRKLIPGSEHGIGFKTLGDAIFLRNRLIDLFEQADVEENPDRRRKLLTIVIVGGGLVGIELMGELTEFLSNLLRSYPRIPPELVTFYLIEAAPRMLPEMDEKLAAYAVETFRKRGVKMMTGMKVEKMESERVYLPAADAAKAGVPAVIEAKTIILAAGVGPNPLLAELPLEKGKGGRLVVESTMRSKERPEVWALGDCALIPDKNGKPYPPLAQHALREAKTLARNIAAVTRYERGGRKGPAPRLAPFEYETMGMLASLGHYSGVGQVMKVRIRGFLAWWVWRTYYVMQMTRWERRLRVILDWTVALFFRNDVVKLDLFGDTHPLEEQVDAPQKSTEPRVESVR